MSVREIWCSLKKNAWQFFLIVFSGVVLIACLYQLEIIVWQCFEVVNEYFMLPFGFKVKWWIARDILYTGIIVSWLMVLIGLWYWRD